MVCVCYTLSSDNGRYSTYLDSWYAYMHACDF